jgi:geranylgeranyl diphosphate synthase type 3
LPCRIDDIQDNSILRRGIPVAHSIYGVANTISAVNLLIFKTLEALMSLNHPEVIKIFTDVLLDVSGGQALEIYWRENYICPSVREYQEMTKRSKNMVRAMGKFDWICAF